MDKRIKILIDGLGIAVLTFVMTWLMLEGKNPFPFPTSLDRDIDFEMVDLYQAIENDRNEIQFSDEIVIVSTDSLDRYGVTCLIDTLNIHYYPKVIGVDIYFEEPHENKVDSMLLNLLSTYKNIVLPSMAKPVKQRTHNGRDSIVGYKIVPCSFFDTIPQYANQLNYGYINFIYDYAVNMMRQVAPSLTSPDNKQVYLSFPTAILKQANKVRYEQLKNRRLELEYVNYSFKTKAIHVISGESVLENLLSEPTKELLRGSIVLLGDMNNDEDVHAIPFQLEDRLDPLATPGIIIHAYTLQTMLDHMYVNHSSEWVEWMLGSLMALLMIAMLLWAKYEFKDLGGLLIRLGQFLLLFLSVWIGALCFNRTYYFVDFSKGLLMIAVSVIAYNIWYGFCALYKKCIKWIKK